MPSSALSFLHFFRLLSFSNLPCSMYSFGKFLELLAYSKTFRAVPMSLCSHTSMMTTNGSSIPDRHSILRHFSRGSHVVTFATAPVTEVYEVRVPRLQIVMDKDTWRDQDITITGIELDPEQEQVRQEIRSWWNGLRNHLQKLVSTVLVSLFCCVS